MSSVLCYIFRFTAAILCPFTFFAAPANFSTRRWTSDDGLPQNRISALGQTPDGYLWCGTWFGLARFDGVRFTVFDHERIPAFHSDAVNSLAVDRVDGALWVATRDGLLRFHSGRWQRFGTEQGLPGRIIWRLLPRRTGGVWLDTGYQVAAVTVEGSAWVSPVLGSGDDPQHEDTVRQLVAEADDSLTFVMDSGLKRIRVGAQEAAAESRPVKAPGVWRAVLLDAAGRPELLGTYGQLVIRNPHGGWRAVPGIGPVGETALLHRDARGDAWAAPKGCGLGRIRDGSLEPVALLPGRPPTDLVCALNDREGGLWLGTSDGLFRVQAAAARTFTRQNGLPNDDVWSVHEGHDGSLWVGTSAGAARSQEAGFVVVNSPFGPGPARCKAIWAGIPDQVWLGFDGAGIGRESQGHIVSVIPPEPLGAAEINCLYGDRAGRLWIGNRHGAFVWQDGKLLPWPLPLPAKEGQPAVQTVLEDHRGGLWFGTQKDGLLLWDDGKLRPFTTRDGLAHDSVWAIHEDADGALWLGGERGLTRLVPPTVTKPLRAGQVQAQALAFAFTAAHGLPAGEINQVLEDDFGDLWLGTLRGVLRVRRPALDAVAAGNAERAAVAVFGVADGMESSETNGERQPAGCKTRDGRIWFPTTRGVSVFDPRMLPREEHPPAVVIEEVIVDRERFAGPGPDAADHRNLALGPGRARGVQFRYTAPTYVNAERARFRHRLRGLSETWHEAGEERVAYFNDLRPGAYTFEVRACNAHGVWQETPTAFAFSLAPSFTQTAWFPASLVLGGTLLAGMFMTWRLRWQHRSLRAEQAAALAEERARIARDLHDDLGTALTGVALELDVLRGDSDQGLPLARPLLESSLKVRSLAARMREVVWAINPRCDTVSSLAGFLEQLAEPLLRSAGIACRLEFPDELPVRAVASPLRHQLALGVREALSNVIRHSGATGVTLRIEADTRALTILVRDNGCGFGPEREQPGHGLANLRERFAALGGTCTLRSSPGEGSEVKLTVPLPSSERSVR